MKKLLNIAHRGYSKKFPENTLIAFHEAIKAGSDGFECDLRMTADGHIVVFHDENLKRLCDRSGTIEKMNLSEIQSLKVLDQEKIPTLEDLLTEFLETRINLEIKMSSRDAVVAEQVLRIVTKIRPRGEILFSSFSPDVMRSLNVMDSERRLGKQGLLVESRHLRELPRLSKELKPDTWNVPKDVLKGRWQQEWTASGFQCPELWTWTLDLDAEWKAVLESPLPFAAVITNDPAAFADFLRSFTG